MGRSEVAAFTEDERNIKGEQLENDILQRIYLQYEHCCLDTTLAWITHLGKKMLSTT